MSRYLMCKDKKVCDVETWTVYDKNLLPGRMSACPCEENFRSWMKCRYSAGTNTFARKLRGLTFGQGNRTKINLTTRAFSLTDCYWLTEHPEEEKFADYSPYFQEFWKGDGAYQNGSIPTLYVDGALPKHWKDAHTLIKTGKTADLELACIRLCEACGISVESADPAEDGIVIHNFTSPEVMLEHADMSGRLDPEEFTNEDIVKLFGRDGIRMLTIDAITGNGDRHAGNFGWLRNADTGEYISIAPLYDFDHALDSTCTDHADILMEELLAVSEGQEEEIVRICDTASRCEEPVFAERAKLLKRLLMERRNF